MESWSEVRERVLAHDTVCNGRFLGGGCSAVLDVHHILPREQGGTDEDSNLMVLCHRHHPMLEAMRRQILKRRGWRRCSHHHPYKEGKILCERRLNAELLTAA